MFLQNIAAVAKCPFDFAQGRLFGAINGASG